MYSFRILENYSKDMFHSSILRFDKSSYLFNCCDGTQRNALDQGIKFPKIKAIFFNSSQTDCYLGCYGFLMSRGEMNFTKAFAIAKNIESSSKRNEDGEQKNVKNKKKDKNKENITKEKDNNNNIEIKNNINKENIDKKKDNNEIKENIGTEKNNNKKKKDKSPDRKNLKPILNKLNIHEIKNNPFEGIQQCTLFGPPNFSQNFIHSQNFCPVPINKYLYEYDLVSNSFICKNIFKENKYPEPIKNYSDDVITIFPICLNSQNNNIFSMSYICIPKQKNRSFNKEKALQLGLKPGPVFGELQKGKSVTLDNGKIITLKDVSDEPLPSSSVLILYIPSEEQMNMLIKNETIEKYKQKKLGDEYVYNTSIIVHITPKFNIINNENYIKFMASFGNEVEHIIECPEINQQFLYNEGKLKIQYLLNKVSNILFPDVLFSEEESESPMRNKMEILTNISQKNNINIDESIPGREYIIYPPDKKGFVIKGLYQGKAFYFKSEEEKNFIKNISEIKIKNIDNEIATFNQERNENNLPRVTFLGTTSMKPGKFRNVSSILIENKINNEKKYILFDCGEGTYQQMIEKYGFQITENILLNIRLIAISHKHGDHMLGLVKILKEIDKLIILEKSQNQILENNYIYVIVPKTIIDFVKNSIELDIINKDYFKVLDSNLFNVNEEQYYKKNLLQDNPNENFTDIPRISPIDDYKNLCEKINNFRNKPELKNIYEDFINKFGALFNTIEVFHCEESFGLFIENNLDKNDSSYWKISFSGDTRPNNNFFNYSMHSTLFIHEGTFDDELYEDAEDKMHSTIGQAINLGKENLSTYIAITHFSPRYIKTYPFKEEFEQKKILLTNDYLTFNLSELFLAYKYLKPFDEVIRSIEQNKKIKNIL